MVSPTTFFSRAFANQIKRPFGLRYNPYTQSVEVLTDASKITAVVSELRGDLCIVSNALRKISEQGNNVDVEQIASLLTRGIDLPLESSSSSDDDKSPNNEVPKNVDNWILARAQWFENKRICYRIPKSCTFTVKLLIEKCTWVAINVYRRCDCSHLKASFYITNAEVYNE